MSRGREAKRKRKRQAEAQAARRQRPSPSRALQPSRGELSLGSPLSSHRRHLGETRGLLESPRRTGEALAQTPRRARIPTVTPTAVLQVTPEVPYRPGRRKRELEREKREAEEARQEANRSYRATEAARAAAEASHSGKEEAQARPQERRRHPLPASPPPPRRRRRDPVPTPTAPESDLPVSDEAPRTPWVPGYRGTLPPARTPPNPNPNPNPNTEPNPEPNPLYLNAGPAGSPLPPTPEPGNCSLGHTRVQTPLRGGKGQSVLPLDWVNKTKK